MERFSTKMIILDKGLPLYHVTYLNTSFNRKDFMEVDRSDVFDRMMKNVAVGEANVEIPDHPRFYGLTPEFPYYYGADDKQRGALEFTTTKPLLLIDLKDKEEKGRALTRFIEQAMSGNHDKDISKMTKCFDGWIGFDDYPDPWREIFLFRPWESTTRGKRYRLKEDIEEYVYEEKELESLHKHLIGCFDVVIFEKEGGDVAMSIEETSTDCTTLSLSAAIE